jgi:hypothetical protein
MYAGLPVRLGIATGEAELRGADCTYTTIELVSCLVAQSACAYGSEGRLHSLASSVGTFDEIRTPSAYSRLPADNVALSERWSRTRFIDLRYYGTPARGGHFAAYEAPAEFVTEVRAGIHALTQVSIRA